MGCDDGLESEIIIEEGICIDLFADVTHTVTNLEEDLHCVKSPLLWMHLYSHNNCHNILLFLVDGIYDCVFQANPVMNFS